MSGRIVRSFDTIPNRARGKAFYQGVNFYKHPVLKRVVKGLCH